MAFTFIVEDGSIVAGANSYISVDDASDYLQANIHVFSTWQALTLDVKQSLLAWGSRYIDQRATWNGVPASQWLANPSFSNVVNTWASPPLPGVLPQQSMRWPRACVQDVDGFPIPYNAIPPALKAAVAEMARYLITTDRSLERPQDGLTELKVADIMIKFRDYDLPIVPSEISYILRGLGTISSGRTNFSKITRA